MDYKKELLQTLIIRMFQEVAQILKFHTKKPTKTWTMMSVLIIMNMDLYKVKWDKSINNHIKNTVI